jgi:DNA-binding beta-propeller fold protein YncE
MRSPLIRLRPILSSVVVVLSLARALAAQAAETGYRIARQEVLAGDVKWNYLSFDASTRRLFITRGDHVDVYDTELRRVVGNIPETPGVHGVALAPELDMAYSSNGRSDTVTLFKLSSLKVLGTLPTGKKPDAIVYDPFSRRVFAANGDAGSLTVIDAVQNEVIATLVIGGKLEFAVVDGKGRLYVNIEDQNSLAVVDTAKLAVLARYDLSVNCIEPTGLSIDPVTERLFVGCRNQTMVVVSSATGKTLAAVPIGKGCDATAYDVERRLAFSSNGEGTLTVVSGETYAVTQTLSTKPTARTLALDGRSHRIHTVAADAEASGVTGGRPRLKSGTFTLLTISQ